MKETSIAIQISKNKIKKVEVLILTPSHPISPAVITNGIILGINEHTKILKERNRYIIKTAIY